MSSLQERNETDLKYKIQRFTFYTISLFLPHTNSLYEYRYCSHSTQQWYGSYQSAAMSAELNKYLAAALRSERHYYYLSISSHTHHKAAHFFKYF